MLYNLGLCGFGPEKKRFNWGIMGWMTGSYWDFFFFFLNLEPGCTWLYCFRFWLARTLACWGRRCGNLTLLSLLGRERSLQRKDLVKIRRKKTTRASQRLGQSARFKVKNQIHAQFHPIRKGKKNGHDKSFHSAYF